jgi:hypothetical protein
MQEKIHNAMNTYFILDDVHVRNYQDFERPLFCECTSMTSFVQ